MPDLLLMDDDKTMLSLLDTFLSLEGFEVYPCSPSSLEQALQTIRDRRPDLVILDVHLQQFSGLALVSLMRQDPGLQAVHVMMSSGMDISDQCYQAGANDFILKPYMPEDLVARLNQILTT